MAADLSAFGGALTPALFERRLRANPELELVLFDRLAAAEQRLLAGLACDPDHYGLLRARAGSGFGLRSVDRETALLFLTLGQPGPLPSYLRSRLGAAAALQVLARMVADGVLEIELEPGRFASGAAAMRSVPAASVAPGTPAESAAPETPGGVPPEGSGEGRGEAAAPGSGGRLAALSRAALWYGQEMARTLPGIEPLRLSLRLYVYHRRPLTPAWRRALPGREAVRRYLGIAPGSAASRLLESHWEEEIGAPAAGGWMLWRPRAEAAPGVTAAAAGGAAYKLFVSPAPEALPECFEKILEGFAAAGAPTLKVGGAVGGLLRPDKIVAYFATFESLAEAAGGLSARLAGIAAHGVPFSSEIAGGGLLSWGVDPPAVAGCAWPAAEAMSWRLWLTHRLARALISGVGLGRERAGDEDREGVPAAAAVEPWRLALDRLRLEGVDTDSWTPGGRMWRQAGEGPW